MSVCLLQNLAEERGEQKEDVTSNLHIFRISMEKLSHFKDCYNACVLVHLQDLLKNYFSFFCLQQFSYFSCIDQDRYTKCNYESLARTKALWCTKGPLMNLISYSFINLMNNILNRPTQNIKQRSSL